LRLSAGDAEGGLPDAAPVGQLIQFGVADFRRVGGVDDPVLRERGQALAEQGGGQQAAGNGGFPEHRYPLWVGVGPSGPVILWWRGRLRAYCAAAACWRSNSRWALGSRNTTPLVVSRVQKRPPGSPLAYGLMAKTPSSPTANW